MTLSTAVITLGLSARSYGREGGGCDTFLTLCRRNIDQD